MLGLFLGFFLSKGPTLLKHMSGCCLSEETKWKIFFGWFQARAFLLRFQSGGGGRGFDFEICEVFVLYTMNLPTFFSVRVFQFSFGEGGYPEFLRDRKVRVFCEFCCVVMMMMMNFEEEAPTSSNSPPKIDNILLHATSYVISYPRTQI